MVFLGDLFLSRVEREIEVQYCNSVYLDNRTEAIWIEGSHILYDQHTGYHLSRFSTNTQYTPQSHSLVRADQVNPSISRADFLSSSYSAASYRIVMYLYPEKCQLNHKNR